MRRALPENRARSGRREVLTDAEVAAILEHGGAALLGWARRVRLEGKALDALIKGDPEPSRVLPFGRRSSAIGSG